MTKILKFRKKKKEQDYDTIWKYPIPEARGFSIEMPKGSDILSITVERKAGKVVNPAKQLAQMIETPYLWIIHNPEITEKVIRHFVIHAPGEKIAESIIGYVGEFQIISQGLTLFVFETDQIPSMAEIVDDTRE